MRKILVLLLAICAASPAFADWTGKDATGATITFKNPNVCTSVVCIPIASLVDATGSAVGTAGAPLRIDPTGTTTQPVSMAAVPTGGATSANQATEITALNSIVTNTAAAIPAGTAIIGKFGIDQTTPGTTNGVQINAALPAGTNVVGYSTNDPCTQATKTNIAIATATGTTQVVAPSGILQVYVCSFSLIAAATATVNLVGGTGATCTTGTPVAALGSTTAASGMSLAANGGLTFGNGGATVVRTTTAGHGLCLIQSGTTALAGNMTYVQQ
jgi:hypothetical protein